MDIDLDSHSFVSERFFHVVPVDLWDAILRQVGKTKFDTERLMVELLISREASQSNSAVARARKSWIWFDMLSGASASTTTMLRVHSDTDTSPYVKPFSTSLLYSPVRAQRIFKGYLGWLLTNPQFIEEHDDLYSEYAAILSKWGSEPKRLPLSETLFGVVSGRDPYQDPRWNDFSQERNDFYFRWRLTEMRGPYLPIPLGSHTNLTVPVSYFLWSERMTGLYFLPDIVPMPSREEFRLSVNESRRRIDDADQLREWKRIIAGDNQGKNQIDRFARVFKLQHYWRILGDRHETALRKSTSKLEAAFASYL